MGEENKIETLEELFKKLQQAQHEQITVNKHLIELQEQLNDVGLNAMADKLGVSFSETSKAQEEITAVTHQLEIELNRLKNEAP